MLKAICEGELLLKSGNGGFLRNKKEPGYACEPDEKVSSKNVLNIIMGPTLPFLVNPNIF